MPIMKHSIYILGGSGFVGSHLCAHLTGLGHKIKLLTRSIHKCRHLKVLPSLSIVPVEDYSAHSIASHLSDCTALINLIGILNEKGRKGKEFHQIHVGITQAALQACELAGVPRLLQMSALNADPFGPSFYLQSKGKAENYLRTFSQGKVHVTIFKPSVIFGENDSFLNRFAQLLKFMPLVFPLACAQARFAPVYIGDVVEQIGISIDDASTFGNSYELCGPNIYSLKELVQYTGKIRGHSRLILSLPEFLSRLQALAFEFFPGKPFSLDNYNSLKVDSVCTKGIPCKTPLETIAPNYLSPHKSFSLDRLRSRH